MAKRPKSTEANEASHTCPICGKPVREAAATVPFCSERCRQADLGRWFNESYRISRPLRDDDEPDEDDFDRGEAN